MNTVLYAPGRDPQLTTRSFYFILMINYIKQEKSVIIFVSNLLHSLFETEVAYYTKYQWQQSAKKCKDV